MLLIMLLINMLLMDSSDKSQITCGVPQGSVLGPLLFLLYINDICSCSQKLNFYLFADDTNILFSHRDLKSLEKIMNDELSNLYRWLVANKLTLNLKKSNFVIFRPHQKKQAFTPIIKIFDNETNKPVALECKEFVKYLGVLIDFRLSWNNHIDAVLLKNSKTVGLLSKLRYTAPFHILISIYNSLIAPYLRYGLIAWGQAAKSRLDKLLVLQKRALRFIHFANSRDHAIPLFLNTVILPLNFLYYKLLSETMHDVSNNLLPSNIQDLFLPTAHVHSYNTRSSTSRNFYIEK